MPTYSLSSAPRPACSTGKSKRVSAQLGRLIMTGSRGSPATSEGSRRGVSDEYVGRGIAACSNNNHMSKAAAWMWYTRGIDDSAHAGEAMPTQKQHLAVNASSINNSTRKVGAGAGATIYTQPSRFRQEANSRLPSDQAASTSLLEAAHDSQCDAEERLSSKLVNHLYDESELSRLHELLDQTEIDKLHSKLSAQLAPCRPSAAISTPLKTSPSVRQIKPLSAVFHKLFKIVYTTVHINSSTRNRNSGMETGRPSHTGLSAAGPRKLGSACVQHVIHHHHHHYHHYRGSSLDSPARDQSLYEPAPRRRRHSYQSCSPAQSVNYDNMVEADRLVDDSLCTEDSVCAHAGK